MIWSDCAVPSLGVSMRVRHSCEYHSIMYWSIFEVAATRDHRIGDHNFKNTVTELQRCHRCEWRFISTWEKHSTYSTAEYTQTNTHTQYYFLPSLSTSSSLSTSFPEFYILFDLFLRVRFVGLFVNNKNNDTAEEKRREKTYKHTCTQSFKHKIKTTTTTAAAATAAAAAAPARQS